MCCWVKTAILPSLTASVTSWRDEFLYDFLAYYYPNDPVMLDYFCSFIVSGNMSLALTWIDNGMKQTPEEMAVLAGEIIMHGVKVLETKA